MNKVETSSDCHKSAYGWMPESIRNDIGHFNVFKLEPFRGGNIKPVHYKKRDYFKITLLVGASTIEYADKVIPIQKQALVFSNPLTSYWEHENCNNHGFSCIFYEAFFQQYENHKQYSIFQPEEDHVFELTDQQLNFLTELYKKMFEEIDSDYLYKYDVLRTIATEMMHFAMKLNTSIQIDKYS